MTFGEEKKELCQMTLEPLPLEGAVLSILETIVYRLEPSPRGAIKLVLDAAA